MESPRGRLYAGPVRLTSLPVLLAFALLTGCGSSAADPPATCQDDSASRALSVGGQCLRLTSARALHDGSWQAIELGEVKVRVIDPPGAGAVALAVSAPAPVEAFELSIEGARGSAMVQQGYQSWSFSGAVKIPDEVPLGADGSLAAKAAFTGDPLDEARGVSYGAALLGDPGKVAVAVAASSSRWATTAIAATGAGEPIITVLHGAARESLPADEGVVASAEIVIAAAEHANDALSVVAAEIQRALPEGARSPARPVGGWYSWNELFAEVTEGDIVEHADILAEKLLPVGLPLLEIDDGWEVAWGDWRANDKFPSGMDGVAQAITAKGLAAGVWLAPFLVDVTSEVAKSADPALFVRGSDGLPIEHKPSGSNKRYHVLDGTNPASMKLATDPILALASQGYGFFKLDFLYAGALPGARLDPAATGVSALHRGLDRLREAMGEGATLNACGAPVFPLLGHADSLRIGSDTAFAGLSLTWSDVAFAARSTAARAFLAPLTWLDGDQTQLRSPYSDAEARASAFVAALSGPAYALGDDLRALPPDRLALALAPEVLDLARARGPATPVDPLQSPADEIVASPVIDALQNLGSTGAPPPREYRMVGGSGAEYTLTFSWTEDHAVTVSK